VVKALRSQGFAAAASLARRELILQSFDEATLRALARDLPKVPRVFLLGGGPPVERWLTAEGLKEASAFVTGIGPAKALVERQPDVVKWAHDAGLDVTPYTFRSGATGRFANVRVEMAYFLFTLGVDALFTDNPDQFPKANRPPQP
jgi:glycerophosphoryl diester phosphodiesterase